LTPPVRLAVIGAGLIGTRHAEHIAAHPEAELAAIADPAPAGPALAAAKGCPWFADAATMLAAARPDGAIVATPNRMHLEHGLACIAAGVPVLVEKPIADDSAAALRLVEAAKRAGVPLLVGHHRRHNPLIRRARQAIDEGRLGTIVAVHANCWFAKPQAYFDVTWRREPGAGPIFINLIHDIDLLRHLCGEIASVQAQESNALRGNAVEETAVALLHFASGALGTVTVSDAVAAPWSWELTAGENPAYSHTRESCYQIGGTLASLALPGLTLWRHHGRPDWWEPIGRERLDAEAADPLALQIGNFCGVIRGREAPVVPGHEGLNTLRVVEAVKASARTGETVALA
jgi:predicted dehydrogenase